MWDELSSATKKKPNDVNAALTAAFGMSAEIAHSRFSSRVLRGDESVEAFAADLKRLLKLTGEEVKDDGKNKVVIGQFIAGLPSQYARELRMSGQTETINDCVVYIRRLREVDRATKPD